MIENNDSVNFYKEAFFQSINHREKVISNIDNQINGLRALFITLVTTLLTLNASGTLAIGGKVVMFLLLPVGFWLMETTAKKVQRGYIFVMNRIQKELSLQKEALDECTIITICSRYAFDYNGHNTFKNDTEYKKLCSFWYTAFMPNVFRFYLIMLLIILVYTMIDFLMTHITIIPTGAGHMICLSFW